LKDAKVAASAHLTRKKNAMSIQTVSLNAFASSKEER
jgi:hypothetical protein